MIYKWNKVNKEFFTEIVMDFIKKDSNLYDTDKKVIEVRAGKEDMLFIENCLSKSAFFGDVKDKPAVLGEPRIVYNIDKKRYPCIWRLSETGNDFAPFIPGDRLGQWRWWVTLDAFSDKDDNECYTFRTMDYTDFVKIIKNYVSYQVWGRKA